MNRSHALLFLALLPVTLLTAQQAPAPAATEKLGWDDLRKPIRWTVPGPAVAWAWDGVHVEFVDNGTKRWFHPGTKEVVEPRKQPAAEGQEKAAPGAPRRASLRNGKLVFGGGRGAAAETVELVPVKGRVEEVHVSPDASGVAYVEDQNLVLVDVASKERWQVTEDGSSELLHGVLDWVYQEEIYGRGDFQGHWWSPDSRKVAFLTLDESQVREFTVVNHVPNGFLTKERSVEPEVTNYPKAGDPNPFARMSVAHVKERTVTKVDMSGFPEDCLVMRVDWTPDGSLMLMTVQDRIQTWARLCAVDPATGKPVTWVEETSDTWVNRPESPRWLADGSFLWLSERSGFNHLYHYVREGDGVKLASTVTSGDWQVRAVEHVDEAKKLVWFEGTRDGATGRNLYRVGFDGSGLVRLTQGAGTHAVDWDKDRTFFLDRVSAMDALPAVHVVDGRDGTVVRADLSKATMGDGAAKHGFLPRERVSIRTRDGIELDASVQLPRGFDPARKWPVFLPTYSGPDAPTVRDSWSASTYNQLLGHEGLIVLQVNVRSASNRGQKYTGACYKQLGVVELRDLEDAVDWVVQNRSGDPDKVAIQGWSYGGFMAAYALTNSTKFSLGFAGAGVYDWRLYDTIYTERYMRTPQENAKGYEATSVIRNAKNLNPKAHLVLVHGTMDDNVHLQNAMQLLWALQTAGKQNFEVMFYPRSRHGLTQEVGGHHREFEWRALQRWLGKP